MFANILPVSMTLGGQKISEHDRSDCFATYFEEKIRNITNSTVVDPSVYNGVRKMVAGNEMFMSIGEVEICIRSIKIKNCEGYDRIPQRVLIEGIDHLLNPLSKLFTLVYSQKTIPEQWCLSKLSRFTRKVIIWRLRITDHLQTYVVAQRSLRDLFHEIYYEY